MKKLTSINSHLFKPLDDASMSYIRGGLMDNCTYSVSRTQTENQLSCNGDTTTTTKDDKNNVTSESTTNNPCNTPS